VGEEAALAHPEVGGEAADRQPLEPLDGGEVDGAIENRGTSSLALGCVGHADRPPEFGGYPNHDHTHDDQEEVFLALRGSGELEVDGERVPLDADHIARVGPAAKRKVWSGPDGIRLLVLGGIPGRAYAPPAPSEIGGPEPKLS
jgi:mannose-6-phosphate isomerase-like protein (cupin superfamily)